MRYLSILVIFNLLFFVTAISQTKKTPAKKAEKSEVKPKKALAKSKKNPAKTSPSVITKTNVTPKKIVTKTELAKLPPNLNTKEVIVMSERELEMINEINILRDDPLKYIKQVEDYVKKYGKDDDVKPAAKEIIDILQTMKPLPKLAFNAVMYKAARQHGLYMLKENIFEHSSLPYFENLSLGHRDIREAVVDLLIDAGIPDRGHRKNLLNQTIKNIAVYEVQGKVENSNFCYIMEFK